jgi:transglutaminase-like putative cysteine protease
MRSSEATGVTDETDETDATDATDDSPELTRVVTCDLAYSVEEPTEVVLQIVAADSAGRVVDERLQVALNGAPAPFVELRAPGGEKMHVIQSEPGFLTVSYRSEIQAAPPRVLPSDTAAFDRGEQGRALAYERQVFLRPSRYVPSDHLIGFAVAQFGVNPDVTSRVMAITNWIRARISYVPGSSDVHDSAEDTLLTGMGTCRDFAHLGIALCRATDIPARFAAVYAPGLSPMDFHAVFEAFHDGQWFVYDATGLAPRSSLVRIATGRDAADTAFAAINQGVANPEGMAVSATVGRTLPVDDHERVVQLA